MGRKTKRPREIGEAPKKCDFRQRAHSNPLADAGGEHPLCPDLVDWHSSFPKHFPPLLEDEPLAERRRRRQQQQQQVEWVDLGCGFGGLLMALATAYPDVLMLGLEIRNKVSQFAHEKIVSLREAHAGDAVTSGKGAYENVDVLQVNAQRFLPQFFHRGQLSKMTFCFPDPHFKKTNHRRRVITVGLCAEYAYCLREGGLLYTVTDCVELHEWMVRHLEEHQLFERLPKHEEEADPLVPFICTRTDESIKVARNKGEYDVSIYRRLPDNYQRGAAVPRSMPALTSNGQTQATARLLIEARLSGQWLQTAHCTPPVADLSRAYAVQRAMIAQTTAALLEHAEAPPHEASVEWRGWGYSCTTHGGRPPSARALGAGRALGALVGWSRVRVRLQLIGHARINM